MAVRVVSQVPTGATSACVAKYTAEVDWLLHMTPMWPGSNAMTDEMSSAATDVPGPGTTNGGSHDVPPTADRLTSTLRPWTQVAHSRPVESRSITRVSDRT